MRIKYLLACLLALVPIAYSQDTGTNTATHDHATANEWFEKNVVTVNKAAGNFSGLLYDWTLTSAPGTDNRLIDFVVDSTSVFRVNEDGQLTLSVDGSNTAPAIRLGSGANVNGLAAFGNAQLNVVVQGAYNATFATAGLYVYSDMLALGATSDISLYRDAAGILAQRVGTSAQESRIYNTYTDASNGEWLEMGFQDTSNTAVIKANANGSGTVRTLSLQPAAKVEGQSLTGSEATSLLDLASTWNTTGTPTALKLNVTDTASNASSLLMDLQAGGVSKFKVDKFGAIILGPSITTDWVGSGIRIGNRYGSPTIQNGSALMNFGTTGAVNISGTAPSYSIGGDVTLTRDAANILAQRNGVNAQESRIYNTWTDASNGEWLEMGFQDTSNTAILKTNANGSGTVRALIVKLGTLTVATLPAAGTAGAGATAFVSDGSVVHAGNSGTIVAGSGANFVPVYSDGTNWRIN